MYSWIFGKYFYENEILEMIEYIDKKRKAKRIKGLTMSSSFADDLKDRVKGVKVIEEIKKNVPKKTNSDSIIFYDNKKEENIKMYVENQFKNC